MRKKGDLLLSLHYIKYSKLNKYLFLKSIEIARYLLMVIYLPDAWIDIEKPKLTKSSYSSYCKLYFCNPEDRDKNEREWIERELEREGRER